MFELDVQRVKVLTGSDGSKLYYIAREHWLELLRLHVVVRGACPEHYCKGHIPVHEGTVVKN